MSHHVAAVDGTKSVSETSVDMFLQEGFPSNTPAANKSETIWTPNHAAYFRYLTEKGTSTVPSHAAVFDGDYVVGEGKGALETACPATFPAVRDACGCEPLQEAIFNVSNTYDLDKMMVLKLTRCVTTESALSVGKFNIAKGRKEGCLESDTTLDEKQRDAMLTVLEQAADQASRRVTIWDR